MSSRSTKSTVVGVTGKLSVFINCPFDDAYRPMLEAIVFTVKDIGYKPRASLEVDNSTVNRLETIVRIIGECRIGIHDISRVESDPIHGLPRFNMPFELGVFLGAAKFGKAEQQRKKSLIFERDSYRSKVYLSDLAGHDCKAHGGDLGIAVAGVRDYLTSDRLTLSRRPVPLIPGGKVVLDRFNAFERELDGICRTAGFDRETVIFNQFNDFVGIVTRWIGNNKWSPTA